jgi:MYXO-CTERM domain-containing protein
MFRFKIGSWRYSFIGLACTLTLLMLAAVAAAAGRIDWASKTLKPRADGNSWNVDIKIFLPRAPDVPTIQMKFEFLQKVYYERAMVDGDKLLTRNVPIEGKQPVHETVDVGFLDPATSKIENRTRFTFKLHRDHGLDCGEYRVTVRDTRNGQIVGTPITLILGGENEIIDRRSIVFTGEKKKEKKKDKTQEAAAGGEGASDADAPKKKDEPAKKEAEPAPANEVPPPDEPPADNPETIKQKPGGCGCHVPGNARSPTGQASLLALAAGLALARRRRKTSSSP